MKPATRRTLALVVGAIVLSACAVREERIVQPAPTTAVVAPAPANVVYTDTVPARTTTVVTR